MIAYGVDQRRAELGLRIALGASSGAISRAVVGRALGFAGAGVAIGLAGAALTTRSFQQLLYGVGAVDPVTFVLAPVVLLIVAAAASWLPAARACRIDPIEVLKGG